MSLNQYHAVLSVILFFISQVISAQTYYVNASSGNDSNDGKRESNAWETVNKVNEAELVPGDKILFKADQQWHSTIRASKSGSSNGFIVYGRYGEGKNPLIDIQYKKGSAFYTNQSYIRIEHLDFSNTQNNALFFKSSHFIEIDSINVRFTKRESGSINLTDIGRIGNNGLAFVKGGSNISINNVTISYAPNNGILFRGHGQKHIGKVTVKNSYIHHALLNDGITIHEDCCGGTAGKNFILEGNIVTNCWESGYDIGAGSFVTLTNNTSIKNGEGGVAVGHSGENVIISNHLSQDEPLKRKAASIVISSSNVTLKDSIITGNGYRFLWVNGVKNRTTNNIKIHNNSFLWEGASNLFDISGKVDNLIVSSNVFKAKSGSFRNHGFNQRIVRFRNKLYQPDYDGFKFVNNEYISDDGLFWFQTLYPNGKQYGFNLSEFKSRYHQESTVSN